MATLLTTAQAQSALPGLTPAQVSALPAVVAAAGAAVERYCRRGLALADYDEIHRPEFTRAVRLKNPPLIADGAVSRVCTELANILQVWNDDPATTRATCTVLAAGTLTLTRHAAGSPAPVVLTLSMYQTAADLCAAIQAVGQGWHAEVPQGGPIEYQGWLVSDLNPVPGTQDARRRRFALQAYVRDLDYVIDDPLAGTIELMEGRPQAYRYPDRTWGVAGAYWWATADPRYADVRVIYRGGYDPTTDPSSVPPDVQEAVILAVQSAFYHRDNPGIFRELVQGADTWSFAEQPGWLPPRAQAILSAGGWVRRSL